MIWFDLDNSPHVPLFIPVIKELEKKRIPFDITAREFAQTLELLKLWDIPHTAIGKHGGKGKIKKVLNLYGRSNQLREYAENKNFELAVSHGSRTQLVAARRMKIKSLLMMDYEYTESIIFNTYATYLLIPRFIPDERLKSVGLNLNKVIRYNGFKEELYLSSFIPDKDFRKKINVEDDKILIVIRPPGMLGNYHDERSEKLLIQAMKYFASSDNTYILISSRSSKDKGFITSNIADYGNVRFLDKAVDGLQLVNTADIVVSGGGTMNRESALLGTKTYSIFTGKRPYLDEYLESMGRLTFINNEEQIKQIKIERSENKSPYPFNKNLAEEVTNIILQKANE